jgi:hypothetical protein
VRRRVAHALGRSEAARTPRGRKGRARVTLDDPITGRGAGGGAPAAVRHARLGRLAHLPEQGVRREARARGAHTTRLGPRPRARRAAGARAAAPSLPSADGRGKGRASGLAPALASRPSSRLPRRGRVAARQASTRRPSPPGTPDPRTRWGAGARTCHGT